MYFFVARHGEDLGVRYPDHERGLTDIGNKQALILAKKLKTDNIIKIYHSPLKRAKDTAKIVSNYLNSTLYEKDILREQKSGDQEEDDENIIKSKGFVNLQEKFRSGESYSELSHRAEKTYNWIYSEFDLDLEDSILLITHGRFMTCLFAKLLQIEFNGFFLDIPYAHYYVFKITNKWRPSLDLSKMNSMNEFIRN